MTLAELVEAAHIAYKGNLRVPAVDTDKYKIYVSIANRKQRSWAADVYTNWASLYREETIDTIAANTLEYSVDSDIIKPAEFAYIRKDGVLRTFNIIKPEKRHLQNENAVFLSGNPVTATFISQPSTEYVGGDLVLPAYYFPDELERPNDEIAVDDPEWLILSLASELARNDYAKDDQFATLAGQANDVYIKMKMANDSLSFMQDAQMEISVSPMGV